MTTEEMLLQLIEGQKQANERFDKIDERFNKIDERLDKMDERLDKMDEHLDKMDERLDKMDERLDKMDERLDKMDERLDKIEDDISEIKEDARGFLAKSDLIRPDGSVKTHAFDKDFSEIFSSNSGAILSDKNYFNDVNGNLYGLDGKPYIIRNDNSSMLARMNEAAQDEDSNVYFEGDINERDLTEFNTYNITDAFYQFLASLDNWSCFADGCFEREMASRMEG